VLSVIYPHVYFPTYSNNLKDIGHFLGCKWKDSNSSGIQSILWREQWEEDNAPSLKQRLITYNKEDCLALKTVCEFVTGVTSSDKVGIINNKECPSMINTDAFERPSKYHCVFGKKDFVFRDLEYVNQCAYFNYQREKVFVRTNRQFRSINKRGGKVRRMSRKPTTIVYIKCTQCPHCGGKRIIPRSERIRSQIDLKYSKHGVRKWVPQYVSWKYECRKCRRKFVSRDWPESRSIYGHSLACWCVYHNIARKQSMLQVSRSVLDVFDIYLPKDHLYRFKTSVADHYTSTYENILDSIVKGSIIHVDETPVKLKGTSGYVWVLASIDSVYYFYKDSREGSFLKEMLSQFRGVLISDFYSAYDSIDCPQQKCLIHLIRDMNDDLFRNPFDAEFRDVVRQFSVLLRTIIDTVDRYGLKRWYLHKHKKPALRFLKNVCSHEFSSEVAQKYQKRFKKSGEKLFTFLDYNGVPWNNNNAEHAINWFAKYRRFADGLFTERSLKELLLILSVFQTCEYNNINVLKFLLSKERTIADMPPSQRSR
ncbi:IS66 family transposase, partial [bacterium]|nr:IS66 family transposase [bacterium]